MIDELGLAVLSKPVPEYGLEVGDVGTVVHVYEDGEAYEVEFLTANGDTIAVLTLEREDVRPFSGSEILHARDLARA